MTQDVLLLATLDGLVVCRYQGQGLTVLRRGLDGLRVTSVIARQGVILAGTRRGVYRSADLGQTWEEANAGLGVRHIRWLAFHPEVSDLEFAGTEPAAIFVSEDGAKTWRECLEVSRLRESRRWFLPYSPAAGCVRGFAFHGSRAYAAVEVGGLLRSDDHGRTWELLDERSPDRPNSLNPDLHSIAVHPTSPDKVYAPTGGGFYASQDGGASWMPLYKNCYCRAVWVDPDDPRHIVLGPADSVDWNGRIERTRDGGRTWQPASTGLEVPWRRGLVERFSQVGDQLLAVLSAGELLAAGLDDLEWRRILPADSGIAAVTSMH